MDIGNFSICRIFPRFSIRVMKKLFNPYETLIGAEIGTFKGENARSIIKELKPRRIYLFDPYETYNEFDKEYLIKIREIAEKNLSFKTNTEIVMSRLKSDVGLKKLKYNQLDFIYIDGNHTYPFVKKDLELSWEKIRTGGVLCGHDFGIPDVAKAVLEFADNHNLRINTDNTNLRDGDWYFIKDYS